MLRAFLKDYGSTILTLSVLIWFGFLLFWPRLAYLPFALFLLPLVVISIGTACLASYLLASLLLERTDTDPADEHEYRKRGDFELILPDDNSEREDRSQAQTAEPIECQILIETIRLYGIFHHEQVVYPVDPPAEGDIIDCEYKQVG
jgi:hypothetical protein